jgi:hypothetical protein
MNEQELLKQISKLPREVRPENDPWLQISRRLDEEDGSAGRTASRVMRAVAAIAVVSVTAAVLFNAPWRAPAGAPEPSGSLAGIPFAQPLFASSEAEYRAAFKEFITVGESRPALPPPAVVTIESGWAEMRQAEQALATALAGNPDNPFLNERMLELRSRQLSFLRQLAVIDHSNRRMTI